MGSGTQGGQFPTRSAQQWLSKCLNCNPGKISKLDLEHKYTNFPSKYISCASFCTFFMYLCALPVFLHCAHVYLLFGEQTAEPNIGSGFFYLRPTTSNFSSWFYFPYRCPGPKMSDCAKRQYFFPGKQEEH